MLFCTFHIGLYINKLLNCIVLKALDISYLLVMFVFCDYHGIFIFWTLLVKVKKDIQLLSKIFYKSLLIKITQKKLIY